MVRSIHPQGWVPIETEVHTTQRISSTHRSIHPQGWVPIETSRVLHFQKANQSTVAFTPKGGCPLKRALHPTQASNPRSSIHPQGWVPIETDAPDSLLTHIRTVAFTPKGGCPLKLFRDGDCYAELRRR